jgi:hypothetical protein
MGDAARDYEQWGEALVEEVGGVGGDTGVICAQHEHGIGREWFVAQLVEVEDGGGAGSGLFGH